MAETTRRLVSDTCETIVDRQPCGRTAVLAYEAMGRGYHAMCVQHAEKHMSYCVSIADARRGRKAVLAPATPRYRNPAPTRVRPTPKAKQAIEDVQVRCAACGVRFRFLGLPAGLHPTAPRVSVDAFELRAPIEPDAHLTSLMAGPDTGFPSATSPEPETDNG